MDVCNPDKENALRKLRLLADQPGTRVWVNHDPEDWAQHRPNGVQVA